MSRISDSLAAPKSVPILERILEKRRARVAAAQRRVDEAALRRQAEKRVPRSFAAALCPGAARPDFPAVIAELKWASPSRGRLRADFDVAALAEDYAAAGAAALSVLTEEDFFLGDLANLGLARAATGLPLLRKDFIFCDYQVWEAAAAGADAILLIAAMLDDDALRGLLRTARAAGLDALCEVHDEAELARAAAAGAGIIGVNHRDLRTFQIDLDLSARLAPRMPPGSLCIAESGLRTAADLLRLRRAGYRAVLMGEHFMQAPKPGRALAELLGAGGGETP